MSAESGWFAKNFAAWRLSSALMPVISNWYLPLNSYSRMCPALAARFLSQGVGFPCSAAAASFSQGVPITIALCCFMSLIWLATLLVPISVVTFGYFARAVDNIVALTTSLLGASSPIT